MFMIFKRQTSSNNFETDRIKKFCKNSLLRSNIDLLKPFHLI